MKHTFRTCLLVAVATVYANGAASVEQQPWEERIAAEALDALNCEVSFLSHIVERIMPNGKLVMAKVHCADKRSFDALRENDTAPFTFKECTPREQKSC